MNVYTYYDNFKRREEPLIDLWREAWSKHGWNPVVLSPESAERHPRYSEFVKAVSRLPTVNNPKYELACYVRHLAMSVIGGGLLTDYDVMCYGFTPQAMVAIESRYAEKDFICTLHPRGVPCAIFGRQPGYEWFCSRMMSWPPGQHRIVQGRPHMSDMSFCRLLKLREEAVCIGYLAEGWETATLVHFPNSLWKGKEAGKPQIIRAVRPP